MSFTNARNVKDIGTLVKLGIFFLVTVLSTVMVVNTLQQPLGKPAYHYGAQFTNTEGLGAGSDVRIAGVRVGQVTGISQHNGVVSVDFELTTDQRIDADSTARVRYADLLGSRYIALSKGTNSTGGQLQPGGIIPLNRTAPPVDLTTLLNGFQPLFDSLQPQQVNTLSVSLIKLFDGQGELITDVLRQVTTLTSSVTGNDALIGRLLANLNSVIANLLGKKQQFTSLLSAVTKLSQLAADERGQISDVIDSTTGMAQTLSGLTSQIGPQVTADVDRLGQAAGVLSRNGKSLVTTFQSLNTGISKLGNLTMYGSWINLYICNFNIKAGPLQGDIPPNLHSEVCR